MSNAQPHVVVLSNSGVGHLMPALRLAASLFHHHCHVTLITCHPILSLAESQLISSFFSFFPQVLNKPLHLLLQDPTRSKTGDAFSLQWDAAHRSVLQFLPSLLSSLSPSPSLLVSDVTLISSTILVTQPLNLPNYVLFVSCAKMFSLFAYSPVATASADFSQTGGVIEIPGGLSMPKSIIPPLLLVPNSIFASIFMEGAKTLPKLNGIILNTFEKLESDTLNALKSGAITGLPPIFPVGLVPRDFDKEIGSSAIVKWLDTQLQGSVVYVNFGSKIATSREQIKELGNALITSGYPFLWVVKDKELDKEDDESLDDVLGGDLMEMIKNKGLVVKEWVNQGGILGHKAIGGFFSHCGWNSAVEAAWNGVRILAWLSTGDQKVNKEVVEKTGLGFGVKDWGWVGEKVVKREEITWKIKEMMENEDLKLKALDIKEELRRAVGNGGGSCNDTLLQVIQKWKEEQVPSLTLINFH